MRLILAFLCGIYVINAQIQKNNNIHSDIDNNYREDQFYFGFTYNLFINEPSTVTQSGFSGGFHLGFIRDMPINQKRNVAIGVGLGYSFNTFNQNILIEEDKALNNLNFSSLESTEFDRNRFETQLLEIPLEFRWRTSNATSHKFYRIYAGVRVGYLLSFRSRFKKSDLIIRTSDQNMFNKWIWGGNLTFGWNTVNFYFYYSINSLFKSNSRIDNENALDIKIAKIGLIFYFL